ncbi:MAG: hypothetical protein GY853_10110 [PVC group bacterium]|nr:hypothetical protein [PVC group bacterium]
MSTQQIDFAEQQILGFYAAKSGETWGQLISGMGLKSEEFYKLLEDDRLDYLSESDKDEILDACTPEK